MKREGKWTPKEDTETKARRLCTPDGFESATRIETSAKIDSEDNA